MVFHINLFPLNINNLNYARVLLRNKCYAFDNAGSSTPAMLCNYVLYTSVSVNIFGVCYIHKFSQ